jgi:hypothetical protein
MELCSLLGGFIAVCYELSESSGLRNRKAALTSVNKAPKRSVSGVCRIIHESINPSEEWLEKDLPKGYAYECSISRFIIEGKDETY